jgi:ribosome-associated toxin RatA of RatAB toxin-antitoxin module
MVAYRLAAAVEDWPRILPHYRSVTARETSDDGLTRTVEMRARRDVFPPIAVPLRWTAIQTLRPDIPRVEFEHIHGITKGMQVAWRFEASADQTLVITIEHEFSPSWPVPDVLVHAIVGEYFVNGVAGRTLRIIGELAETQTSIKSVR